MQKGAQVRLDIPLGNTQPPSFGKVPSQAPDTVEPTGLSARLSCDAVFPQSTNYRKCCVRCLTTAYSGCTPHARTKGQRRNQGDQGIQKAFHVALLRHLTRSDLTNTASGWTRRPPCHICSPLRPGEVRRADRWPDTSLSESCRWLRCLAARPWSGSALHCWPAQRGRAEHC